MTTKAVLEVPPGMQRIHRRFERWRSSHQGRLPIPEALWASAAAVARGHGVLRTAKILRLEYGKLKRMAESDAPARRAPAPPAEFLERSFWSWWHHRQTGAPSAASSWKGRVARCASSGKGSWRPISPD